MSIGFDPVVSPLLFAAGLVPHTAKPQVELELPTTAPSVMPFVTAIVALYREKWDDIEMTLASLIRQSYPKDRLEVLIVVEADDEEVRKHAETGLAQLRVAGIRSKTVVSDGGRRLKAYALNRAVNQASGEVCAFYDASDDIAVKQIETAVRLMVEKNYDAVQATVLRKGKSILSEFLLIDTAFWFRKYLPFVLGVAYGIPLSGEGLFLRTSALKEVGGFPEVLTEDAYLGIILTERNKRFGLVSSVITEKAPRNIRAHFVQRLRWNRGYLTCLVRLLRAELSLKRKAALLLPFLTPLSCSLAFLGWILITVQWLLSIATGSALPIPVFSMSTILFYIGIPLCVSSYVHTLWVLGMRRYSLFVILLPYYWTFLGIAATCSFFKNTTHWGKTDR
jgi:cellulose synthase/poly-beta-1,6-N-acetylglucosamine synthase-like glycosyltransferase